MVSATVTQLAEHVAMRKRERSIIPQTSEAFEKAWGAFPEEGRRRSSKIESWPQWKIVIRSISEAELLSAVIAFSNDPKERSREHGPPGFHRWLKWGRWEHWLNQVVETPKLQAPRFPDESLRASFYERFSDPRARAWFDRTTWDDATREITEANPVKQEWAEGPFRCWAIENDIRGLSFKGRR